MTSVPGKTGASPYIAESIGKETVFVYIMMKDDLTVLASTLFNV